VIFKPGPTEDVLGNYDGEPIIRVDGAEETSSDGQLRLVTVSVYSDPTLLDVLYSWVIDDESVLPREFVYPPDRTEEEIEQENAAQFTASQDSAETAALRELGCEVHVMVTGVREGSPAQEVLRAGDELLTVDDEAVTSVNRLRTLLETEPDRPHQIGYLRDGQEHIVEVTPGESTLLDLELEQEQPCQYDVEFDISDIGGPSAGLMFALGIIDHVDPEDLTGGYVVAGTGEINDDGEVGPIGGIPQKLVGARRDGATVFLTPEANCAEAVANAVDGLMLVSVATLDDALDALEDLREGRQPPLCAA